MGNTVISYASPSYEIDAESSTIVPRLLLLLMPIQYHTSIHSLGIYFEVNFVASLLSLLTFHETICLIVQSLFSILSLADVYSSYDVYCTSGECVVVQKWVQSPEWRFP